MSYSGFHCVGIDYTKYCNGCLVRVFRRQMDEVNNLVNQMTLFDDMEVTHEEHKVLERLLNDAIWDFCFDIHRALKMGYLFLDPNLAPDWEEKRQKMVEEAAAAAKAAAAKASAAEASAAEAPAAEAPGADLNQIPCPNCKILGNKEFHMGHIKKCFGKSRNEGRRKDNFIDFGAETSYGRSTRGKRGRNAQEPTTSAPPKPSKAAAKPAAKAAAKSAPKPAAKPTFKDGVNFESMTYDELKAFLDEKCGALTVKKTRCLNSVNCKRHVKERAKVREEYLSRRSDSAGRLDSMNQAK